MSKVPPRTAGKAIVDKVPLTIDGKKLAVEEGMTILQAAQIMGIEIPHLCYDERLTPLSACRLCVVEVEGLENLVSACSYPVSDGLVVKTDTERVKQARKLVLELILSNHPLDCLTCEKSGDCELEKYAYELEVSSSRFKGEKGHYRVDASNPFIERDNEKCILCGRCVAVCDEVQMCSVLDYTRRGFKTKISTGLDRALTESDCVFCGQCIAVCPVGALTEKERKFKGREWELRKVSTICPYCGCGCNIVLNIKEGRVLKVTSEPESIVNQGWLCSKGKFGFQFIERPDRLTIPLIKKDGEFKHASWDEALDLVAHKFKEIKEKYGEDSIAGFSSAKCTNEENYLFQKFMRAVIGTNNVDHCARLCHASSVAGLARAFGSGAMTNSIEELRHADCILLTGSNTSESHPIIALEIKAAVRRKGARLIVADPRKIEMTDFAWLWLRQRPGTDVALFNGMMNVIVSEALYDKEFIEKRTQGFEELKKMVERYTPDYVEGISGVPSSKIVSAARGYAGANHAAIVYAMGITQHTTGTDNVLALANLAMLTGNVGKESSGVNPLRGHNNVQGACDVGALPNVFPGYQPVEDKEIREKFERAWGVDLPGKIGLTVVETIHAIEEGKIKAMYIMGENSPLSDPNAHRTRQALAKLDFLVVQDIFPTETTEYADVVLPAACFAEKEGTFTNTERRVQKLNKALDPPGETKADWKIISELAAKFGYKMEYKAPAEVMNEIASLTPIYGGIKYERLNEEGLQWPCLDEKHPGTRFLHKDRFSRGLGKFHPTPYTEPRELPDEEYPFILSTGRVLYHWHTGTMTRRVRGLEEIYPEGLVEIHPLDAERIGLASDELVEVSSRRGKVVAKAKITEKSPPGTVFMTFHFKEAAANLLTIDALDPIAKIPEYKVCAVKVQKIS
jgi:formate dehydrogenase alpha subunit